MTKKHTPPNTIDDFGTQWTQYTENTGYYGTSKVIVEQLFANLLQPEDIENKHIADVGAGSGRYTTLLHQFKPKKITAIEPSQAFSILQKNTAHLDNIEYLSVTAEHIPANHYDAIFCIGVLPFIADPEPALIAMGKALSDTGRLFLWVYGVENNRLYLSFVLPLRKLTSRLPHKVLHYLTRILVYPASFYAWLCQYLPLPIHRYMKNYYYKLNLYSRQLVIYDQLNPKIAHYYRKEEIQQLLERCHFTDIRLHHHLGYSWSISARYCDHKPTD